jgi:hypothetical protein
MERIKCRHGGGDERRGRNRRGNPWRATVRAHDNQIRGKTMAKLRTAAEMQTIFGEDDLLRWVETLERNIPDAPSKAKCLLAPQVVSFQLMGAKTGLWLTLKTHDGETLTVALNPVVAKKLVDLFRQAGKSYGWLDEDVKITFPIG